MKEPAERDKHDLFLQQSSTQRVFWVGGGWGGCVCGGGGGIKYSVNPCILIISANLTPKYTLWVLNRNGSWGQF